MQISNFLFLATSTARTASHSATTSVPASTPTASVPADSYSAGTSTPSRVLTPQQALAMKAQNKPAFSDAHLMDAIAKHDYSNLVEQMSRMPHKRQFVADFHKNHPAEYAALAQDIRDGKVNSPSLKVAVALDTLNGTRWARTAEGAKVTAHLGKLYDQGRITSMDEPGGLGRTDMTGGTGRDGKVALTTVAIKQSLLDSPEAVATVLAHEGQHSFRASTGSMQRSLREEVDAHQTQNAVWGEFGPAKYTALSAQEGIASLDKTATYDTEGKLYSHIAAGYAADYVSKRAPKAAAGVFEDYEAYARQNNYKPSNDMKDEDLSSLLKSAAALSKNTQDAFVTAVGNLQAEADSRGLTN